MKSSWLGFLVSFFCIEKTSEELLFEPALIWGLTLAGMGPPCWQGKAQASFLQGPGDMLGQSSWEKLLLPRRGTD